MTLFYFLRYARTRLIKISPLFFLWGCSTLDQSELRIVEKYPAPTFSKDQDYLNQAVFLDARPYYQYASAHLDTAYWQDVEMYKDNKHFERLSRALARKGITPTTPVIVLGNARSGAGEECRMALGLYIMGINKASFVKETALKAKRSMQEVSLPQKQSEFWPLQLKEDIFSSMPKEEYAFYIDVRSKNDYLAKSLQNVSSSQILNIPWQNFIDAESGMPNLAIQKDLEALRLNKKSNIYIIDADNQIGACALMALWSMGYEQVKYYKKVN